MRYISWKEIFSTKKKKQLFFSNGAIGIHDPHAIFDKVVMLVERAAFHTASRIDKQGR